MPKFQIEFFVRHGRELSPQLDFSGTTLHPFEVKSPEAAWRLTAELDPIPPASLQLNGSIYTIGVFVDATDEAAAMQKAFIQASQSIEPYSLVAPERAEINFSRFRPEILPNALLVDMDADPPNCDFRYQDGPRLMRLGGLETARRFNHHFVRRVAGLYPRSLLEPDAPRTEIETRIGRAVHWYSEAEGLPSTMALVCYWIGLESLVIRSSNSAGNKRRTIARRVSHLKERHLKDADMAVSLEDLWDKRADIVHEGYGTNHGRLFPEIRAEDINSARYHFLITML